MTITTANGHRVPVLMLVLAMFKFKVGDEPGRVRYITGTVPVKLNLAVVIRYSLVSRSLV